MVNSPPDTWQTILNALESKGVPDLQTLLGSSSVTYDGAYTLTAGPRVYSQLCQYYPLIDTVVQDISGKRLKLTMKSTVPMGTVGQNEDLDNVSVELGSANITEAIIAPESIVAVPSYLLRFVPYVGSGAVLIATALRQAFYRASREHGGDQLFPKGGDAVTINVEALLQMLGHVLSRATFFRIFKSGNLDWFVQRAEPVHRFAEGKVTRAPNTYTYRGMLLTPGDAQDLFSWFQARSAELGPVELLNQAITTSRDQLLTFPYRIPIAGEELRFPKGASVHSVLQAALSLSKLSPSLAALCDRLAAHLLRPESFLAVPWYWFQRVLPELGADLGMLYLMSRACCYVDWARGKDRNTFWVAGGLQTLQAWIGSETLPKRIPQLKTSSRGRPRKPEVKAQSEYTRGWRERNRDLAGQYLYRLATRQSESGTDWQLRVSEVQLTPADEMVQGVLYSLLLEPKDAHVQEALIAFSEYNDLYTLLLRSARFNPAQLCHFETLREAGICQNETLAPYLICHFDILVDLLNSHFETLVAAGICQFEAIIKILYRLKNTDLFPKNSQPTYTEPLESDQPKADQSVDGQDQRHTFEITDILEQLNPLLRQQIIERQAEHQFLSWLIYGSLNAEIRSPLSFAVSRTLETGQDAGGAAKRLAYLQPEELTALLIRVQKRIAGGYLGWISPNDLHSEDLSALLEASQDQQTQRRLIQRLLDHLKISS